MLKEFYECVMYTFEKRGHCFTVKVEGRQPDPKWTNTPPKIGNSMLNVQPEPSKTPLKRRDQNVKILRLDPYHMQR